MISRMLFVGNISYDRVKFPRKTIAIKRARLPPCDWIYKSPRSALEMFLVLAGAALNVLNRFHVRKFPTCIKLGQSKLSSSAEIS